MSSSILLRVNSKFKRATESESDFSYELVSSQAVASVTSISLIEFTVNRLFTNINASNNIIQFYDFASVLITLTLPIAQYTVETLIVALNLLYVDWTWTLGADNRLVLTTVGTPINLLASSTLAQYIGLTADLVFVAETKTMQSYPQLQGPDEIYVQSSIMASGSTLDDVTGTGGSIPLLGIIPCGNVPYGFTVNYQTPETSQFTVTSMSGTPNQMKRLFIQITDKYGNLLNIPDLCHVDLLFKLTYMPS